MDLPYRQHLEDRNFIRGDIFQPISLDEIEDRMEFSDEQWEKIINVHNTHYEGYKFESYLSGNGTLCKLTKTGVACAAWLGEGLGGGKQAYSGYTKEKYIAAHKFDERQVRAANSKRKHKSTQRPKIADQEYTLTNDMAVAMIDAPCYCCLALPEKGKTHEMERLDSSVTYTLENVKPACKTCNAAKGTKTFEEHKNWVKASYENLWQ